MDPLQIAIDHVGTQAELARRIGVPPQVVHEWRNGKRPIPSQRCVLIESLTSVACERLRPDLEWHVLPDGRKVAVGKAKTPSRSKSIRKRAA